MSINELTAQLARIKEDLRTREKLQKDLHRTRAAES